MTGVQTCALPIWTISTGILNDLVSLANDLDGFRPDVEHINALPGPFVDTSTILRRAPIQLAMLPKLHS